MAYLIMPSIWTVHRLWKICGREYGSQEVDVAPVADMSNKKLYVCSEMHFVSLVSGKNSTCN